MKHLLSKAILFSLIFFVFSNCHRESFITVNNGQFVKDGKPYFYIGTNYWYGANLAADTIGGDRMRLKKELNFLKENGIDNLRILVGAEGPDNQSFRVTPTTFKKPYNYSPKLLEGLDYLLNELHERDMHAILYFTNNWEWSGGMAQYLNWNGYGDYVNPNLIEYTWPDFFAYQKQFYSCQPCVEQLNHFIQTIISRKNTINGKKYTDDPTIMAWELANEPRPMAADNFEPFINWISSTAKLIHKLDTNHLITTGNEGTKGCSESMELFDSIHSLQEIDYITLHIWMKNWGWYNYQYPDSTFPLAMKNVQKYLADHMEIARELKKPMVIEEFGIARDNQEYMPGTSVKYRNKYYEYIFEEINKSALNSDQLVGCNFWTFGGYSEPIEDQIYWKAGDPYMGDPPQEEQGLNSVFPSDTSTIQIIKKYNTLLGRIK